MAVLVFGEAGAVLRIKVAYVGAPGAGIRTTLTAMAKRSALAPSSLRAVTVDEDDPGDDSLSLLDLALGAVEPPRVASAVRAYLYAAKAPPRDEDEDEDDDDEPFTKTMPALVQALQSCDAIVLVVRSDEDGMRDALGALTTVVQCLFELEVAPKDLPLVVQCNHSDRRGAIPPASIEDAVQTYFRQTLRGFRARGPDVDVLASVATEGRGIVETLERAVRAALASRRVKRYLAPMG